VVVQKAKPGSGTDKSKRKDKALKHVIINEKSMKKVNCVAFLLYFLSWRLF
jgi:U3 small nucleolar RNA-associated protein 14